MPKLRLQVGEDAQDLRLHDHVERRRRLVRDEELRPQDERERDHDPLAHAARELVRVLAEARRRDAHLRRASRASARGPRVASRPGSCCLSVSGKWSSIRMSGFSLVIGSWKMRPRSGPRSRRSRVPAARRGCGRRRAPRRRDGALREAARGCPGRASTCRNPTRRRDRAPRPRRCRATPDRPRAPGRAGVP